ncbi:MAG: hypothetical protein AB1458_00065 [Bacteroidota bacterium]
MTRVFRNMLVLCAFLCFCPGPSFAQNTYGSEEELKKKANDLFEEEEFVKGYPLFSQLLALYPKDPAYNYRFGVCMLYSVAEKEKAIVFLETASKYPEVEMEVWYYLGRAYHLNYRFVEAVSAYNKYKENAPSKKVAKYQVDRQIEMCNNGKKLLKNLTDLVVMDKKELNRSDFFRSYDLTEFNAKLIVTPDEFKTDLDKKKKDHFIMYSEQGKDEIYFSSYGKDGKGGKDIYVKRRLPNGEFGKPVALGYPINTEYDEDYPFLHPNGKILYFCSKGHNSMGGYDVFKSERNEQTGTWSKPVNMDFAINTPDDDFMFVSDANDQVGYFASTRESSGEMVTVYKIQIERKPADIAIITGKVKREDGAPALNAKITVKDMSSGQVVGVFNAKEKTGSYLMNLPNGGKFLFTVEAPGFKSYSESVEIPVQYELKPLGQDIVLKKEPDGTEVVKIINKFDQNVSDADYLSAMEYIKQKSKLNVNYNQTTASNELPEDSLDDSGTTVSNGKDPDTKTDYTNEELIKIAYDDAKDVQKEANELKKDADQSLVIASQKNDEAMQKQQELDQVMQNINAITDPQKKQEEQKKAEQLQKEKEQLSQETVAAYNLSEKLNEDAKKKQEEADFALKYAKDLERALNSSTNEEVITKLNEQKEILDKMNGEKTSTTSDYSSSLNKQAEQKQVEANNAKKQSEDARQEIVEMQSEADRLKKEADSQKNPELKQSLLNQVDELNADIKTKQKEADDAEQRSSQLQADADRLKVQADYADNLVSQLKEDKVSTSSVSSIDKEKLSQQVNSYETSPPVIQTTASTTVKTDNSQQTDNTTSSQTTTAQQPGQSYSELYSQQLKDADTISDPYDREKKKSEIYANWSADAKKEQDALKGSMKNLKTKQEKEDAKKKIDYLDAVVSEKSQQAELTAENAQKLKEQQSTQTTVTADNTSAKEPVLVVSKEEINSVNSKYEDRLKKVEEMPEGYEKEKARQEVYAQWSGELKQKEEKLQQQLDTAQSLNSKIAIQDAINQVSGQTKEKDKLANASQKKADDLKSTTATTQTQDPVKTDNAQNDQIVSDLVGDISKSYEEKIASADDVKQPYKRDSLKSEIYSEWGKEIRKERDSLSAVMVKTKKKSEKESLKAKIDALDKEIGEKEALANASFSDYIREKPSDPVVSSSNPVSKTEEPVKYDYTSPEASQEMIIAANLEAQSDKLMRQSDSLKNEAAKTSDPAQQAELYAKADDLKKQSDDKKKEADNTLANANKIEYNSNTAELKDLSDKKYDNEAKVTQADLLQDEAKTLFDKAQEEKIKAQNLTGAEKQTAMNNALSLETQALGKQEEAKKIYSSLKVVVTADNTTSGNKQDNTTLTTDNTQTTDTKQDGSQQDNTQVTADNTTKEPETNAPDNPQKTDNSAITATEEYKQYESIKQESGNLKSSAASDYKKSAELKTLSDQQSKQSQDLIESTANISDPARQKEILQQAEELDKQSLANMRLADSLKNVALKTEELSKTRDEEADKYLQTLDKSKSEEIAMVYKTTNPDTEPLSPTVTKTENNTENKMPEIIMVNMPVDKIEIKDQPVYSKTKPIPVNEKLPEGLIFKVQVGAFKNPIPQDLFRGITPITAETTPLGFTRYTAGIFTNPEKALQARDQIRGMGYKDAFVVAFYNGKRISYEQAMDMMKKGGQTVLTDNTTQVKDDKSNTVEPDNTGKQTDPTASQNTNTTTSQPVTTQVNDVKSTDVKSVSGLFYTVQVGVYSKKVTSAQLYGISPLNSEMLPNGLIRYTSGTYKDVASATQAKEAIVKKGVKDAFVTAYYNGKRITLEEAAALIAEKGTSIVTGGGNPQTGQNDPGPDTQPEKDPEPKKDTPVVFVPIPNTATASDTGVVYKVQIGAYKEQVPITIANQFVKIASQGISTAKQDNGITLVTVGSFKTYAEAVKAREAIIAQGVDAFVIATKNNKKIFIQENLDEEE